ncbi:MAG: alginate export family protein [bacterium]|nr:MAG: alginate export family protein [bacterium]
MNSGFTSPLETVFKIFLLFVFLSMSRDTFAENEPKSDLEFTWGYHERVRQIYMRNVFDLDDGLDDDFNFIRVRSQLWFDIEVKKVIELYAMINNEHLYGLKPAAEFDIDEFIFENLYIKADRIGGSPVTFTIGRQNIKYDEGFLYMDGSPLDKSRTYYMNAAHLTLEWELRKLEVHFIFNPKRDEYLPRINSRRRGLIEHDELGAGLRITERSFSWAEFTGYYLYKEERSYEGNRRVLHNKIHIFGGRLVGRLGEYFKVTGEGAFQLWQFDTYSKLGFGGYLYGGYAPALRFRPSFTYGFIYLSGSKGPDYTGWNPIFSRWSKWSALYSRTLTNETGFAYWSNLVAQYVTFEVKPLKSVSMHATLYNLDARWEKSCLWVYNWPEPPVCIGDPFFGSGRRRGLLSVMRVNWKLTKYLSGHLLWERFEPGSYYSKQNRDLAHFLRWEVYFKY